MCKQGAALHQTIPLQAASYSDFSTFTENVLASAVFFVVRLDRKTKEAAQ